MRKTGALISKVFTLDLTPLLHGPLDVGFDANQEWYLSSSELVGEEVAGVTGPVYRGLCIAQAGRTPCTCAAEWKATPGPWPAGWSGMVLSVDSCFLTSDSVLFFK